MRLLKLFFLSSCLILLSELFAQSSISGVINDYTSVTSVNSISGEVSVTNSTGLSVGQEVLIIQMKGATINQNNSSNFGFISNFNQAGNHEIGKICAIQGNDITLSQPLSKTYNTNGQVQLISVPVFNGAIISGSDLSAQTWNGSTGGVLVFKVNGTLDLGSQNIDVSTVGFRGATAVTSGNGCTFIDDLTYFTASTNADAKAEKGEGIAALISGKECGRGSQANGGGGGNNHNAGGGGGANYGAGGAGGQRVKATTFTCGSVVGTSSRNLVSGYNNDKIFLGGGGGAGHGNNTGLVGESGLNGGGIAIIIADTVKGNGQKILANGGSNTTNSGEGGGGAGAGGTVVLLIDHYVDSLYIEVNGGNGISTANVGSSNCNGPGGGGGGGAVLFNDVSQPVLVDVSLNGGVAGEIASTSQSNCTVGSKNGAGDGQSGGMIFNWELTDQSDGLPTENITDSACAEYESPSGKYIWTKSGLYEDTVTNSNGCQKVYLVDLTIDSIDTRVINNGNSLEAVAVATSYQWIDCVNGFTPVSGAVAKIFSPSNAGAYAVVITNGECSDTSSCYDVQGVGITNLLNDNGIFVYPNPVEDQVNIKFSNVQDQLFVELMSVSGQVIRQWSFINTQKEVIYLNEESGLYLLRVYNNHFNLDTRLLLK